MKKILFILFTLFLTGCAKPEIIKEDIDTVNKPIYIIATTNIVIYDKLEKIVVLTDGTRIEQYSYGFPDDGNEYVVKEIYTGIHYYIGDRKYFIDFNNPLIHKYRINNGKLVSPIEMIESIVNSRDSAIHGALDSFGYNYSEIEKTLEE